MIRTPCTSDKTIPDMYISKLRDQGRDDLGGFDLFQMQSDLEVVMGHQASSLLRLTHPLFPVAGAGERRK